MKMMIITMNLFNRNMGCIEIDVDYDVKLLTKKFNRNMGCIEIIS